MPGSEFFQPEKAIYNAFRIFCDATITNREGLAINRVASAFVCVQNTGSGPAFGFVNFVQGKRLDSAALGVAGGVC